MKNITSIRIYKQKKKITGFNIDFLEIVIIIKKKKKSCIASCNVSLGWKRNVKLFKYPS